MFNRYGLLMYGDESGIRGTAKDPELGRLFYEMYREYGIDFTEELDSWCMSGSDNCSFFYMGIDYERRVHTGENLGKHILPTYGIRGMAPGGSGKRYVNQYFLKYEESLGSAFLDYVFGTAYLKPGELKKLNLENEVIERMRKKTGGVSHVVGNPAQVCRIMERIWAAWERDPKTRILLILEDARRDSMDLLRQLYLMLPQRLRVQAGFQTNITPEDLNLVSRNGLPVYLFTMDKTEANLLTMDKAEANLPTMDKTEANRLTMDKSEASLFATDKSKADNLDWDSRKMFRFPVERIEVDKADALLCDPGRLEQLGHHCERMSAASEDSLNYAEWKVLREGGQEDRLFGSYGRIMNLRNELYLGRGLDEAEEYFRKIREDAAPPEKGRRAPGGASAFQGKERRAPGGDSAFQGKKGRAPGGTSAAPKKVGDEPGRDYISLRKEKERAVMLRNICGGFAVLFAVAGVILAVVSGIRMKSLQDAYAAQESVLLEQRDEIKDLSGQLEEFRLTH